MFRYRGLDLRIREQPLQLARALPIESKFDGRGDQSADQARAKGQLHVEQQVEAAPAQLRAQAKQFPKGGPLIEGDKLDSRSDFAHQLGFDLADDPGEPRFGPRRLEGSQRRQCMAGIADCGETQQADVLQRRFEA